MTRQGSQSGSRCIAVAFLLAACGGQEGGTASAITDGAELEAASKDVVAFLQGTTPFGDVPLADSVALYVAPEGGGGRSVYSRDALRQPSSWKVMSGQRTISLAPPPGMDSLTAKAGRHFNCREYDLASRYPELARQPHVGTKLEPSQPASCLQAWNLTLVFDSTGQRRITAVVYDQWEW